MSCWNHQSEEINGGIFLLYCLLFIRPDSTAFAIAKKIHDNNNKSCLLMVRSVLWVSSMCNTLIKIIIRKGGV